MITEETARKQLHSLHQEGYTLAEEFGAEQLRLRKLHGKQGKKTGGVVIIKYSGEKKKEEEQAPEPPPTDETRFEERYQSWYSRALPLMKQLALDRYAEFQSFYVVDPRYPWGNTSAYVIQDYFRGRESDDACGETARCFKNQLAILKSVGDRVDWMALDTEDHVARALQLAELETARDLVKISERASGALAGTVLQTFLAALAQKHKLKFRKHAPSSRDYAEALKTANVLDVPVWSQSTWLAEIHDRCLRPEGEAPTKAQVRDLIDGTHWLITNVF